MKVTAASIEGLLIVLLGAFMGLLLLSDHYWLFLNPKFTWLSASAAGILTVVGVIAVFHPRPHGNPIGIVIFSGFLLLSVWSTSRELQYPTMGPPTARVDPAGPEEARMFLNGREYIRINIAELFSLCEERKGEAIGERFVVRGYVMVPTDAGTAGGWIVARTLVTCCLADAVAVGFRVLGDVPAQASLNAVEAGRWIQVFGRMQALPEVEPDVELKIIQGVPLLLHPRYTLMAEFLTETAELNIGVCRGRPMGRAL